jgi:hypothetical protein
MSSALAEGGRFSRIEVSLGIHRQKQLGDRTATRPGSLLPPRYTRPAAYAAVNERADRQ